MAGLPDISVNINTGGLGRVARTDDNIFGIVCSATATTGFTLGAPYQIFSLNDLIGKDVTPVNNAFFYKEIEAFYNLAKNGTELWVLGVSDATTLTDICDVTKTNAKKLLDAAKGAIRVLGINRKTPAGYTPTVTECIDADVVTAMTKLQELCEAYALEHNPLRGILPGIGFLKANVANLKNLDLLTNKRVMISLAADAPGSVSVCRLLGMKASVPVQRKISRVLNGNVKIDTCCFPDGTPVEDLKSAWDNIHTKGYVFFRTIPQNEGYYFSSDRMAVALTDDYSSLARGLVIDKAHRLAVSVYAKQIEDDYEVDSSGKLPPAMIAATKSEIENTVKGSMQGEISDFVAVIDPNQNVLSTDEFELSLSVMPRAYKSFIKINLGLYNPYKTT